MKIEAFEPKIDTHRWVGGLGGAGFVSVVRLLQKSTIRPPTRQKNKKSVYLHIHIYKYNIQIRRSAEGSSPPPPPPPPHLARISALRPAVCGRASDLRHQGQKPQTPGLGPQVPYPGRRPETSGAEASCPKPQTPSSRPQTSDLRG